MKEDKKISLNKHIISQFYTLKIKGGTTMTTSPDTETCPDGSANTCRSANIPSLGC